MKPLSFGVLFVLSAVVGSCAPPAPSSDKWGAVEGEDYVIKIDDKGQSGFRAFLPDNSMFSKSESYARAIPSIVQEVTEKGGRVVFVIETDDCGSSDADGEYAESGQCLNMEGNQALKFGFHVSYEIKDRKPIAGCINEVCTPGSAFRLHRNGSQLADLHIGRFYRNGRTCVGFYESQFGFCETICPPTEPEVREGIRKAIVTVGVTAAAAWLAAKAIAPLAVPVLVL